MRKRDRLEVIHDFLRIIQENNNSIKPTPLLRKSNLSSQSFSEYLGELVSKGFVKEIEDKKKAMAIGIIGLTTIGAGTALAFGGGSLIKDNTDLQNTLQNKDYSGFVEALGDIDSDAAEGMTEDRFSHMVGKNQAMQAVENEDFEEFQAATNRDFTEEQFQDRVAKHKAHIAVETAIEDNDYEAWVEAVSVLPHAEDITEIITADDFDTLVQLHEAKESGDHDTARELASDLGLPKKGHHKGERGMKIHDEGGRWKMGSWGN